MAKVLQLVHPSSTLRLPVMGVGCSKRLLQASAVLSPGFLFFTCESEMGEVTQPH